jgi:hypothetical protein
LKDLPASLSSALELQQENPTDARYASRIATHGRRAIQARSRTPLSIDAGMKFHQCAGPILPAGKSTNAKFRR